MAILLLIIGGIIGLIVLFFVLSSVMENREKSKAPEKLEKAKMHFKQGEQVKCLDLLQDAFYVPSSGRYTPETAKVAVNVLQFLKRVLSDMGIDHNDSVDILLKELQFMGNKEKGIPESLTAPVEKLLENINMGSSRDMTKLMEMVQNGEIEVRESKDDEDFTRNLDERFNDTVNSVGKMLMRRKISEAINLLTPLIPSEDKNATATFLEQRAACYTMEKKYEKAIEDYKAILKIFPAHHRTMANIRDVRSNMK